MDGSSYALRDTLVRIVSHARRFRYRIGPRARDLIRREYDPMDDAALREHIRHKHPDLDLGPLLAALKAV